MLVPKFCKQKNQICNYWFQGFEGGGKNLVLVLLNGISKFKCHQFQGSMEKEKKNEINLLVLGVLFLKPQQQT